MMLTFVEKLPGLLRQLADPVTPHTAAEFWCRIHDAGWHTCIPVLLSELQGNDPDVKWLVLEILGEQAEQVGTDLTESFRSEVERLLTDEDRLVRMAAVIALRRLFFNTTPTASAALRQIVCNDERQLAREALITLLELDDSVIEEVASLLRGRPS